MSGLEPIPVLPGIATASELMRAVAAGLDTCKFFRRTYMRGHGALAGAVSQRSPSGRLAESIKRTPPNSSLCQTSSLSGLVGGAG